MVILIFLIGLFLIFFLLKKHIGPALLAVIAGVSVYTLVINDLIKVLGPVIPLGTEVLQNIIYLIFVLGFPVVLYITSAHTGLFGVIRIVQAGVLAAILTLLCASKLAFFFSFDTTSVSIVSAIANYQGWIMIAGIAIAYVDILLSRSL